MTNPADRRAFLMAAPAVGAALALGAAGAAPAVAQPESTQTGDPRLRTITRENSVLVMVDFMEKLLDSVKSHSRNLIVNNATALATTARIFALPTFVLGDEGERLGTFNASIHAPIPMATRVPRHTVSAWREPAFVRGIEASNRRNLIVAGISTDMCVSLLALDARRAGYDVTLVVDASGSQSLEMHQTGVTRLLAAGVTPVTWVALAAELMGDWQSPQGGEMARLYANFLGMN